ncbi:MAG: ABC transporter ATP-binding protein [Spirochaetales bacterium]|nr:ABC transporter ATP-binding protein [Spirochaetales bacterium]
MKKSEFKLESYKYNHHSPSRWIFSHLMRYPFLPVILLILAAVNNGAYSNMQYLVGSGFEVISRLGFQFQELLIPAYMIALSALIQGITGILRNYGFEYLSQQIEKNSREELYIHLLGKSQTFHGRQKIGDIMARATNDVKNLNYMFNPGLMLIFDSALAFIMPCVWIAFIHPLLLIVPGIFLVFLAITVWKYNQQLKPVSIEQREQFGTMNSNLAEMIEGIEVVKANVREKYEWNKFTQDARSFKDYFVKQGYIQAKYWPLLVFAAFWAIAFFYALYLVQNGLIQFWQMVAYLGLFNTFRFSTFISLFSFNLVQLGFASAARILKTITTETELDENPEGHKGEIQGQVEFKQVGFSFNGKSILKDINFKVDPGMTCAIVGQTGSGKTTLTRLINRIFDVTNGVVEVDNRNVKDWNIESLRSQISTIEQDIFLYSKSIRENITFGRQDALEEEIIQAAKDAQAHDFITHFKDGYDTVVGQRGVTLSGGQKQRIAIARAFLTNPRILILDDSTSAIDSATEDQIQQAMRKISEKRTTFIITHRLSQIRWADIIIVIRKGQIEDLGSHEDLLSRSQGYRKLFT